MSRRRLMAWAAAGTAGTAAITAAGALESAQPALAVAAPAAMTKGVSRPVAAAPHRRPVYTVHQILPHAPADAVALTIDDGPDPHWTPRVLALLRRFGVRATFSLIGVEAHAHRALVREIIAEGHAICNHSMTHPQPFTRRSATAIEKEISRAQSAIVDAAGTPPRLFRSPGGDWSPAVFTSTARHGMTPIDWDVDPRDWSRPGPQRIINRLLAAKPGDILLCHDGGGDRSQTVAALRTVLPRLKGRGYTFVTL
jgi:peptidoglycan/xylan/chitin deacetylase (PgdA/CDA1 family)